MRVNLARGIGQARMRHDQSPGAEQKVQHRPGHLLQVSARTHVERNLVGLRLPLFSKLHALPDGAAVYMLMPVLLVPLVLQPGQCGSERPGPVDLKGIQGIESLGNRLEEGGKLRAAFVVVTEAALRHPFHQTPPRVAFLAEKTRVHHRQTQQRRLQRHNGLAHRHQQARVPRHLVDQFSHHLQAQHLADAGGVFF